MLSIDLTSQVAVVTGGSRGIGAAIVKMLADAGAQVAFSYVSQPPRNAPPGTLAVRADARDPEAGEALVAAAIARFGRLDIAVANAGVWNADDIPLEKLDFAAWQDTVACNLNGVYALARAAVQRMKPQRSGRIIAIASTAGQRGEAFHTHYGAAKAGVIGFVRGLAPEVARDGILVNCVAPGWIETDMSRPVFGVHPERVFGAIPLGRVGTPDEIAGPVAFLCSSWANFMTGSVVSVNGGAVLA